MDIRGFNPRSRTGNDNRRRNLRQGERCFNPRSRTGNDSSSSTYSGGSGGFNPRSRTGNDAFHQALHSHRSVSIHVPARGTTQGDRERDRMQLVSIHVPARGTTCSSFKYSLVFQVSIHVPARGTTRGQHEALDHTGKFQSTFPHGERLFLDHPF